MKRKLRIRLNPAILVTLVAVTVVVGMLVIRYFTPEGVSAKVTLAEREKREKAQQQNSLPSAFDESLRMGTALATAQRINELAQLVLVIGVKRLEGEVKRDIPMRVEQLLGGLQSGGQMPPGMVVVADTGKVNSPYSTLFIRYRAVPFAVEVISLPRSETKGNTFIMRLPSDPDEEISPQAKMKVEVRTLVNGVAADDKVYYSLFSSAQTTEANIPAQAFLPTEQMIQAGWVKETIPRPAQLTAQQIKDLDDWLKRKE